MLRNVSNEPRGCGTLKEGKCYLQGRSGPGGTLKAWVWLLGTQLSGSAWNWLTDVPPRMMQTVDFQFSLADCRTIFPNHGLDFYEVVARRPMPDQARMNLVHLPRYGLLDHVGSVHYTPASFARECAARGPSRAVPRSMAANVAKLLKHFAALPIIFTHSDVPLVNPDAHHDLIQDLCFAPGEAQLNPTWWYKGWGLHKGKQAGKDHWAVDLMDVLDRKELPADYGADIVFAEQVFGVSWITSSVYVTRGDETPDNLSAYIEDGIEPVQIAEVQA